MVKQFLAAVSLGLLGTAAAQKGVTHIERLNVYQVLNVNHNIAFRYIDNTLRGVDYNDDAKDWGDMGRFKYFQTEVYNIGGTSILKWWVSDTQYTKIVVKNDDKTFVTNGSEIGEYPGDGLTDRFVIRRSKITDNHGGRPAYITAKIGDSEYALNCADPGSEIYSKVNMKAFSKAEDLSTWNLFYFAKQVPLRDAEEVYNWAQQDSTFYFFNRDSKTTLTTEKDEHHKLTVSAAWGDSNRFTLVQREEKPYFDMYNYSKKTRDNTMEDSDFRVRTNNNLLTIGVGGTLGWKFANAGNDEVWCYFVNNVSNKKMYHQDGYIRDSGTGSTAQDQWQLLRVYNDAADRAKSVAEEL